MTISRDQIEDYLSRYAATLTNLDAEAAAALCGGIQTDDAEKLLALAASRGIDLTPRH